MGRAGTLFPRGGAGTLIPGGGGGVGLVPFFILIPGVAGGWAGELGISLEW